MSIDCIGLIFVFTMLQLILFVPSELGVSPLVINSILFASSIVLFVIPAISLLRYQKSVQGSAFSK